MQLIAHRGYASKYPENTLLSIRQAIAAGACFFEFDVQFTKDSVPVMIHDHNLNRTADIDLNLFEYDYDEIKAFQVNETKRFGQQFTGNTIATLKDVVKLLIEHPKVQAFVEIKEETLVQFEPQWVVDIVIDTIQPVIEQCTIISFAITVLELITPESGIKRGWVIRQYNEENRRAITQLQPSVIFCNIKRIPETAQHLWPGPWAWACYEITESAQIKQLTALGVTYAETMQVEKVMVCLKAPK